MVSLTAGLAALLRHDGPWADAIARHGSALQAAKRLGDHSGLANALNSLGAMLQAIADRQGALLALEQALNIYRDLGDQLGQANALSNLGTVLRMISD